MVLAQALLLVACSGGSGGEAGGTSGTSSAGTTSAAGTTANGGARTGGATSAAGNTSTGGVVVTGGAGTGGHTGAGGTTSTAGNTSVPSTGGAGGTGGAGTGGRTGAGGAAGAAGTNVAGATAGGAAGGSSGGAAGGGQPGSGGQGGGGQSGTGGTPAVTCGPAPTCAAPPTSTAYTVDTTGVTFTVGSGKMKVQVCTANIIRVEYASASSIPTKDSLSVSNTFATPPTFCVAEASGTVTITTACMKAKVATSTGLVSYTDASDTALVAESSKSASGKIQTVFTSSSDEALFGLGQQPSNNSNRKNSSVHLSNSNGNIFIPVVVSNKGYGLFWDNPSVGDFSSSASTTSYTSGAGEYGGLLLLLWSHHRPSHRCLPHDHWRRAVVPQVGIRAVSVQGPLRQSNRSPERRERLPQRQDPGRLRRSRLGLLGLPIPGAPISWIRPATRVPRPS